MLCKRTCIQIKALMLITSKQCSTRPNSDHNARVVFSTVSFRVHEKPYSLHACMWKPEHGDRILQGTHFQRIVMQPHHIRSVAKPHKHFSTARTCRYAHSPPPAAAVISTQMSWWSLGCVAGVGNWYPSTNTNNPLTCVCSLPRTRTHMDTLPRAEVMPACASAAAVRTASACVH